MARASRIGKVDLGPSYLQDAQMVDYSYLTEQVDKTIAENNKRKEEISSDIRTNLSNLQDQLSKNEQLAATNADVVSQRAIQFSESASQKNLQFNRLYQQGKMSRDEFLIATNNVNRSATNLNHFITTIDGYRQQAMERQDKVINQNTGLVEGQKLDAWLSDQYEGYRNLSNHAIYMDDSGQAYFGKIDSKTGGISKNPSDFNSIASTNTQTPQKYLNKDMDKYTTGMTKTLGAFVAANITGFETVEDALLKPGAVKYIEDKWNEFSKNDFNVLSVITNQMGQADNGEEWSFTYDKDEADANSNLILLEKNSNDGQQVGIVSDHKNFTEGKKKAKEKFATEARAKVARKEKPEDRKKLTAEESKQLNAAKIRKTVLSNVDKLLVGDTAQINAARSYLKGKKIEGESTGNRSAFVEDIIRNDDGVTVKARVVTTDKDGKTTSEVIQDFDYPFEGQSRRDFAAGLGNLMTGGTVIDADVAGFSTDVPQIGKYGTIGGDAKRRYGTGATKSFDELNQIATNKMQIDPLATLQGTEKLDVIDQQVGIINKEIKESLTPAGIKLDIQTKVLKEPGVGETGTNALIINYKGNTYTIPYDTNYEVLGSNILENEKDAMNISTLITTIYEKARTNSDIEVSDIEQLGFSKKLDDAGNVIKDSGVKVEKTLTDDQKRIKVLIEAKKAGNLTANQKFELKVLANKKVDKNKLLDHMVKQGELTQDEANSIRKTL